MVGGAIIYGGFKIMMAESDIKLKERS